MKRICLPQLARKALASLSSGREEVAAVEVRVVILKASQVPFRPDPLPQLEENERRAGNTLPIFTSRCKRQTATHRTHSRTCPVLCTSTSRTSPLLVRRTKEVSQCNAYHCGAATKLSIMCGKLPIRSVGAQSTRRLLRGESVVFALRI